jgi:hypothetical protein
MNLIEYLNIYLFFTQTKTRQKNRGCQASQTFVECVRGLILLTTAAEGMDGVFCGTGAKAGLAVKPRQGLPSVRKTSIAGNTLLLKPIKRQA